MSVAEQTEQLIPVGTWKADPMHSSVGFAVKHHVVATFRGKFTGFEATLVGGEEPKLAGVVKAASIVVEDENLYGHLQSPDFFDVERFPELRFESSTIRRDGDRFVADAELDRQGRDQAGHRDGHDRRSDHRPVRRRAARAHARDDDRPLRVRDRLEHAPSRRRPCRLQRRRAPRRARARQRSSRRADPRRLRQPAARVVQHAAPPRGGGARAGGHRAGALRRARLATSLRRRPRRRAGAGDRPGPPREDRSRRRRS